MEFQWAPYGFADDKRQWMAARDFSTHNVQAAMQHHTMLMRMLSRDLPVAFSRDLLAATDNIFWLPLSTLQFSTQLRSSS